MKRPLLITSLAVGLALLWAGVVEAHANLVRSVPAAGATLDTAPANMLLEFSEELDPEYSRVQLFDSQNKLVNPGPGTIDPAQPKVMTLALGNLSNGSYTALWRTRSAADGHITNGSIPFGIGVPAASSGLIPPRNAPDPALEPPPLLDSVARWLNWLAAAVAWGWLPFGLLVWRPLAGTAAPSEALRKQLSTLILFGTLAFILTNIFFVLEQAATAAEVPVWQALGAPLFEFLGGASGRLWLLRLGVIVVVGVLGLRLQWDGKDSLALWWLGLGLVAIGILTFSLSAHAAAVEDNRAVAVLMDWLHVTAMVAWLGGLVPLTLMVLDIRRQPNADSPLPKLIPRFSALAITCVITLAVSGLYSYLLHVNQLDLLLLTTYGRVLSVKTALFGILIALGAVNLVILSPRLRSQGAALAQAFGRTVRVELFVGALVLLAVGLLTSVAPSQTAWALHQQQVVRLTKQAVLNNVTLKVQVAPGQAGNNEFAVDVTDQRPNAEQSPGTVILRLSRSDVDTGTLQVATHSTDGQRFTAQGSFVSIAGQWQVEVIFQRPNFDDVRAKFDLNFDPSAPNGS